MVAMRNSSKAALAVGRFAGWEPLGFEAGDENWYRFVENAPTAKTDSSGLDWSDCMPGIRERNGMICGYSVWLLTGSCCALPNVVEAATNAWSKTVNCWWDCVVTIHKCPGAYVSGAAATATTLTFTHLEYATGISKPLAGASNLTTLQSRLAHLLWQNGYRGVAHQLLRSSAQAVSRAPIGTGVASVFAGISIVEAGFSIYCGYKCS